MAETGKLRRAETSSGAIEYILERKKVKNINLHVRRDCTVYVSAPRYVPVREIECFIAEKSRYILQAQEYYRSRAEAVPRPVYTDGAAVKLLGRDMELKVIQSDRQQVTSDDECIYIMVKDAADTERIERLYSQWLAKRCSEELTAITQEVWQDFQPLGIHLPELKIRTMKARWGSCHYGKGMIVLNRRLIEAPPRCIAHVVAHELCHFIYPNHSADFYALLDRMSPDWRSAKAELERLVILR